MNSTGVRFESLSAIVYVSLEKVFKYYGMITQTIFVNKSKYIIYFNVLFIKYLTYTFINTK